MVFTYDTIKQNIETYKQAREKFSLIRDYEEGKITISSLTLFGLGDFGEFYNLRKRALDRGSDLVMFITFKDLKDKIVKNTKTERLAKLFSNKTQPKFKKMVSEDGESFDKLANGRWMRKPSYRRNGTLSHGTRSHESVQGIKLCFVELLNWLIINEVPVYDKSTKSYNTFTNLEYYTIRWYLDKKLSFDNVPVREMDITNEMMNSFIEGIEQSKIDFRKLNSDFIITSLQDKIRSLMTVPDGTMIKCLDDRFNGSIQILTKDKSYRVNKSMISSGFLRVLIVDDTNINTWYSYTWFEDMQIKRNELLDQLFG